MAPSDVTAFVNEWVESWNTHDLERILSHFADDVIFESPLAANIVPQSKGVIHGKQALRDYWREGLRLNPDLRFEVEGIYLGIGMVVINYRNSKRGLVSEVLIFEGDLVAHGHGAYLEDGTGTPR